MIDGIGCLYRLTFPNGKAYIGITSKTVEHRVKRGHIAFARLGRKVPLLDAIRKYGEQSFRTEILAKGRMSYLAQLEIRAIECFKTCVPNGYNLALGGQFPNHSAETRKQAGRKIAAALTGKTIPPAVRAKMSASHLRRSRKSTSKGD